MTPTAIDKIINDPIVSEASILVGEYAFQFTDLFRIVHFRIWKDLKPLSPKCYYFTQSHYIQTPDQATPYMTDARYAETAEEALRLGVRSITSQYAPTIGRIPPEISWLKPNTSF